MKYTQIQREEYEPIITIGEYILETAPEVFMQLYTPVAMQLWAQRAITTIRDVTEKVLAAANLSFKDMHYAHVMTERLLPRHGGLLPGEREEVLYD